MKSSHRFLAWVLFLIIMLVSLSGCSAGVQQEKTLKVGLLGPLTGTFAALGLDMRDGMMLYLEERGNKIGDYKVEVVVEDDTNDPATSLTKARKLVEKDKVDLIVGPISAACGLAVAEYCNNNKVPLLMPVTSAEDLTQRKRSEYVIRTGWTSAQPMHPFGEYAFKELGLRKITAIGHDYAFGHEVIAGFQRTFEEAGGKILKKIWVPSGTPDFGPYLAQVSSDSDAVVACFSGSDAIRFVKQYKEFGLGGKVQLLGVGTLTDEHVLYSMGDEAIGIITALHYSPTLPYPETKKLVDGFSKKTGRIPSYYVDGSYTAMTFLEAGLKAAGSLKDVRAFSKPLQNLVVNSARGPVKLDQYNNPIQNIYIRKVEKVNGKLQNTVIKTYEGVSQFWKYNPEEFLKNPVYSRDYPPLKN
ncbi:MAG: ABC transporter substrate-binding protein [Bacillota bacterium]